MRLSLLYDECYLCIGSTFLDINCQTQERKVKSSNLLLFLPYYLGHSILMFCRERFAMSVSMEITTNWTYRFCLRVESPWKRLRMWKNIEYLTYPQNFSYYSTHSLINRMLISWNWLEVICQRLIQKHFLDLF